MPAQPSNGFRSTPPSPGIRRAKTFDIIDNREIDGDASSQHLKHLSLFRIRREIK
jgi:hypothetical protein